jgi:hypothetical protein
MSAKCRRKAGIITPCFLLCGILGKGFREELSPDNIKNWNLYLSKCVNQHSGYWVFPFFSCFFPDLQLWTVRDYRNGSLSRINSHLQPTQSASPHSTRNSADLIIKIPVRGVSVTLSLTSLCVCLSQESERESRTANHRAQRVRGTAQSQGPVSTDFLLWCPQLFSCTFIYSWPIGDWVIEVYYLVWKQRYYLLHIAGAVRPAPLRVTMPLFGGSDLVTCPPSFNDACWWKWRSYVPHECR